jgi:hypothetical protein
MVTDAPVFAYRCRGGVLNGVTVCAVGSEPWRKSLSDRTLIAENGRSAFTVVVGRLAPDAVLRSGRLKGVTGLVGTAP